MSFDPFDEKILGELVADASQSYSQIGEKVNLSAPSVHARVKKLKQAGVIETTQARLAGKALGKSLLVFIHLITKGWGRTDALMELAQMPEFEELHSVTGNTCMILKVRVRDTNSLETLLLKLHAIENVVSTETFVVLSTYVERPVQPAHTPALETEAAKSA